MALTVGDYLASGKLQDAIDGATTDVRARPGDAGARYILAQLLCIKGEFERADGQLNTIAQQEIKLRPAVTTLRQVIRAEQARRQFFDEGRLPEFLRPPPDHIKLHLEAIVSLRAGASGKAVELLERAEEIRPHATGTCNGHPFDDFRDLDDMTASYFEILTVTGKFYIVAIEDVTRLEFHQPENPCDLIWRRVEIAIREGLDGEVYMPAIYAAKEGSEESALVGRSTEWIGGGGTPTRGVGQRSFLVGEEDMPIMQLAAIEFTTDAAH